MNNPQQYKFPKRLTFGKWVILMFCLGLSLSASANPMRVVTTTTILKDFVEVLGGDQVQVSYLIKPYTDPHLFVTKPGDLSKIRESDLFVKIGGDEEEWTLNAVANSGNYKLIVIDASTGVTRLDIPTEAQLRQAPNGAHLHKSGNPYYWMNPDNVNLMLENILEGLVYLRPKLLTYFMERRNNYLRQLNTKMTQWTREMASVWSQPLVTYHQSWSYFADKFRLNIIAQVEPLPGITPSISYLNQLIHTMKEQKVRVILVEPYYADKKVLTMLTNETQVQIVVLPMSIGITNEFNILTYIDLMNYNVRRLTQTIASVK